MAAKYGTRGSNSLTASASSTELYGQGGNDTLRSGTIAGVSLFGEEGNDALYAKSVDLLIDGGAGVDTVYFAAPVVSGKDDDWLEGVENVVITNTQAGSYDFSLQTEGLNITGNRQADTITGGSGNDTITGGLGVDSLVGGAGNDLLVAKATDAKIDGGDGTDTVRFAAAVASSDLLDADLVGVENVVIAATRTGVYDFSSQGVTENLNITGGKFAETIIGGAGADTLAGGSGNDRLVAASGDALVDGGGGADTVVYGANVTDRADAALVRVEKVVITKGSAGSYDFSSQSEGLDITGTNYADVIKGGRGADALRGGLGADILYAGDNDKLIDGGNAVDTVYFTAGVSAKNLLDKEMVNVEAVVIDNSGNAAYDFSVQLEKLSITGGDGNDTITGGKGVDTILGGNGDDLIVATDTDVIDGDDSIAAGNGTADTVRFAAAVSAANLSNDDLKNVENIELSNTRAAAYDFNVQTEALNITGSGSNDTIFGGSGADTIRGGAGNDVLVAADNDVLIDGGTGTDTLRVAVDITTALTDLELTNVELIEITDVGSGSYDFSLQTESLQITGNKGVDTIKGGFRADTITGGEGADALYGNDGGDVIVADASDTLVDGGDGDDTVRYNAAVALATGTDGRLVRVERIEITNTSDAAYDFSGQTEKLNITGNRGSDTITGGSGADTLNGGLGNDVLVAQDTDALIDGGAGVDTVRFATPVVQANLADADLVNVEKVEITNLGNAAYDFGAQTEGLTITGSTGDDTIDGGSNADYITGGAGSDSLKGNGGADTLVGGDGNDILDGGIGSDVLMGGDGADVLVAEDTDALINGGSNAQTSVEVQRDKVQFRAGVSATNLLDADMVEIEDVEITNTTSDATYDFSAQTEALIIKGNTRSDIIIGGQDWDDIDGGAGNDTLGGSGGLDTFHVLSGNDTIIDLEVRESLEIGTGATATATGVLDYRLINVYGGGVLNIIGTPKADAIWGSNVNDSIQGLDDNDAIDARDGYDTVLAGAGDDSVFGGLGNDSLDGGVGSDTLDGGSDNDTLIGGAGTDKLVGGDGDDVFLISVLSDINGLAETIDGGNHINGDKIVLGASGTVNLSAASITKVEKLEYQAGGNVVQVAASQVGLKTNDKIETVVGGAGADTLRTADANFDLSGVTLSSIENLGLMAAGATTLTVDDDDLGTGKVTAISSADAAGVDLLKTADATLNVEDVSLTNIDTLESTKDGDSVVTVSNNQLRDSGVTTIKTAGNTSDTDILQTNDSSLNLVGVTLINIDKLVVDLDNNGGNDTVTVDAQDLIGLSEIAASADGSNNKLTTPGDTLDVSAITLTNIDTLESTFAGNSIVTVSDDQLRGSGVTTIATSRDSDDNDELRTAGGVLNLSGITLINIDKVYSSAAGATTITMDANDLGLPGVTQVGSLDTAGADLLVTNDDTLDVSGLTLINVDTLTVDADNNGTGPQTITVLGSQVSSSDPTKVSTIGSPNSGQMVTLRMAAGGTLDLTGVTLVNIDSIAGSTGNDTITGRSVDDTIVGGLGADSLDGGAGNNTLTYSDLTSYGLTNVTGVAINLSSADITADTVRSVMTSTLGGSAANSDGPTLVAGSSAYLVPLASNSTTLGDRDRLTNFQNVIGSSLGDYVVGSAAANTIDGGAGNDYLSGGQGDDLLMGGQGIDTIDAGEGVDTVIGGDSRDVITLGAGNDIAQFGSAGSLVASRDSVTDYAIAGDTLDFGTAASLVSAGGTASAGISVATSASGNVTFAAADDTVAEKIAAIQADSRLDEPGKVAIFQNSDPSKGDVGSYIYYSGASTGNDDDQIVLIAGLDALDSITITGTGDVQLDKLPTYDWPISSRSILSTRAATGGTDVASSEGYVLSSSASRTLIDADPYTPGLQFGTSYGTGDDYYNSVDIRGVFASGLNFFNNATTPYYTTAYVGSNGYITFARGYSGYVPSGIPGFTYAPMIAAQFDDLYATDSPRNVAAGNGYDGISTGTGKFYSFVDTTNHRVVFTWDNMGLYSTAANGGSTGSDGAGSAFQIILHALDSNPNLAGFQYDANSMNFGIEIRYEDVRYQYSTVTAGWTAGDQFNYALIDNNSTAGYDLNNAVSDSNIGIGGVWAWNVIGGVVESKTWLPDIDPTGGADISTTATAVMYLDVQTGGPATSPYTPILVDDDGGRFTVEVSDSDTFVVKTVAGARWNLWKEAYKDGMATIKVGATGSGSSGSYAAKDFNINIYDSGLDTVSRDTSTSLRVRATSNDLNTALDTELATVTTVSATTASSGVNLDLHLQSEALSITGSGHGDTITGTSGSDSLYGGNGDDKFQFASGVALNTDATVSGGDGLDTIVITAADTEIVDTDFDNVSTVELLTLTGISTAVLASNAHNAGIRTVNTGDGHTGIVSTMSSALTLDAELLADEQALTLSGTGGVTVTNLLGDLTSTSTGTVTATLDDDDQSNKNVTLTNNAVSGTLSVNSGSFDVDDTIVLAGSQAIAVVATDSVSVTTGTASASVSEETGKTAAINATAMLDTNTLTISGQGGFTVTGLKADLTSTAAGGAVSITTTDVATQTIALGTGTTGTRTVNANALADGHALTLTGSGDASVTLVGGDLSADGYVGKLAVTATTGTNVITTGSGEDNITAGSGNDSITGGAGADSISAGDGNDILVFNTGDVASGEILDGGNDNGDIILVNTSTDFSALSTATIKTAGNIEGIRVTSGQTGTFTGAQLTGQLIKINATTTSAATLTINVASGTTADFTLLSFASHGEQPGGDAFTSGTDVININGAAGNEAITGTSIADTIAGGDGDDTITGGAGADYIDGGAAIDTVDYSTALKSDDTVLTATNIGITLTLNTSTSATVTVGSTNVGADSLVNVENVVGTNGIDTITGDSAANSIQGGAGADIITGGAGADSLIGGDGGDVYVYTGTSDVDLSETITESSTSSGTDRIRVTGSTNFTAMAGENFDQIEELELIGAVSAVFSGSQLSNETVVLIGGDGVQTLNVVATAGGDTDLSGISAGVGWTDGTDVVAIGGSDNSTGENIVGTSIADFIKSYGGDDTLTGGAGADTLHGGTGIDTVSYGDIVNSTAHGLTGISGVAVNLSSAAVSAASISTAMGGTVVIGGGSAAAGEDLAAYTAGYLAINATSSTTTMVRDKLFIIGSGSQIFMENENVQGSALADFIVGSDFANVITGGGGADNLTGGNGSDTFVFGATRALNGSDTITDFTAGTGGDVLDFSGSRSVFDGTDTGANDDFGIVDYLIGDGGRDVSVYGTSVFAMIDNQDGVLGTGDLVAANSATSSGEILVSDRTDAIVIVGSFIDDQNLIVYRVYDADGTDGIIASIEQLGMVTLTGVLTLDSLVAANIA